MNTRCPVSQAARRTALFGCVALVSHVAFGAPQGEAAGLPEAIRPPAGERLVLKTHASGAQIYTCAAAADGKREWTLKAPDAELRDARGTLIIHHFAGPTWKHSDGSEVTARAVAHSDAPGQKSVAWLLLEATSHSGSGVLTSVTHIQRVHTHGGLAPPAAECTAAKLNSQARVAYTADYYFYAAAGSPP